MKLSPVAFLDSSLFHAGKPPRSAAEDDHDDEDEEHSDVTLNTYETLRTQSRNTISWPNSSNRKRVGGFRLGRILFVHGDVRGRDVERRSKKGLAGCPDQVLDAELACTFKHVIGAQRAGLEGHGIRIKHQIIVLDASAISFKIS